VAEFRDGHAFRDFRRRLDLEFVELDAQALPIQFFNLARIKVAKGGDACLLVFQALEHLFELFFAVDELPYVVDEFVGIHAGGIGARVRFKHFLRPLDVEQVVARFVQGRAFRSLDMFHMHDLQVAQLVQGLLLLRRGAQER